MWQQDLEDLLIQFARSVHIIRKMKGSSLSSGRIDFSGTDPLRSCSHSQHRNIFCSCLYSLRAIVLLLVERPSVRGSTVTKFPRIITKLGVVLLTLNIEQIPSAVKLSTVLFIVNFMHFTQVLLHKY